MATIYDLLKIMIEKGASDLHITTGSPPRLRVDGKLLPLDQPSPHASGDKISLLQYIDGQPEAQV